MEGEGNKGTASCNSGPSPRRLVKRATTWEISDSENEEEPSSVQRDDQKAPPSLEIETTEISRGIKKDQESLSSVAADAPTLALPLPISPTPIPIKKTRKKRSPEELEAERAQAEEREREAKRLERERRKDLDMVEKEKRREAASSLKLLRPDQCVKYMTVQMDAGLLEDAGSEDVLEALRSSGYNYSIEPYSVPRSFTWRREMPSDWTCVEGLELTIGEEEQMLVLLEAKDFVSSVCAFAQAPRSSRVGEKMGETIGSVFGIPKQHPEKKVTLVVMGLQEYRLCNRLSHGLGTQSLEQTEGRGGGEGQSESSATRRQIEEALVSLQLSCDTEVLYLETWRDLGQHVCAVTKSVAQRPFRKHWESQAFSFCTSAGTWHGWGRESLSGLPLVWKRQIQQLNRVSPAMSAAVTQAYPSPQLLVQYDPPLLCLSPPGVRCVQHRA
ncbi:structure-specific endonuclease subunit EME2 isoform X2 [Ascaphus truei]|uniref:structure-specific endonuclease subunit EME2 isoform X2 n=1 Tax=Ascaphus truei TaxID=8439 RepID=UPI003F5A385C